MKTKLWIGAITLITLIAAALLILIWRPGNSGRPGEEEIEFSTGCNDIIDISVLPQDKKTEVCNDLISSKFADLEKIGLEPRDCQTIRVEAVDCKPALGTELVCTYSCRSKAE